MDRIFFIPSSGPESWKDFLASKKHWKKGYSAKTMAYCWEDSNGFPKNFNDIFLGVGLDLEMILALPEYKVYLDTKKAPSQNDLFVLSRDSQGLATIMVEGKVSESFGKTVKAWQTTPTKLERMNFLISKLEINGTVKDYHSLRYQLFHRTVSAILVADQFHAKKAIMIVHSFSQTNERFDDYSNFIKILNPDIVPKVNEISFCKKLKGGIDLYVGWIKGDKKYLKK
ncbi:MAG TPA: hypothetical protein VFC36_00310 [Paludibacter sp.]|nr:hypothetical protein [Paludibacter sp.]